jgi:transcriptional regulator with XRE-family HTH domain
MAVTNEEFAERVGVHFTMASRMRNGNRLPSVKTMISISNAFDLKMDDLSDAYAAGPDQFGEFLRENIFDSIPNPSLVA